jgi:hypothetical protein
MATNVNIKQGAGFSVLLFVLLLCAGATIYILAGKYTTAKEKASQMAGNYVALADSFDAYTLEVRHKNMEVENVIAAKTYRLTLDRNIWKNRYRDEAETVKALKIKNRNLESIIKIQMVASDSVRVTTIYIDPLKNVDSLKFETKYMKADLALDKKNIVESKLFYKYYPDLLLTTSFQQKSILWGLIKWGKKFKSANIISKDVNCVFTNFEYKELIE